MYNAFEDTIFFIDCGSIFITSNADFALFSKQLLQSYWNMLTI